MKINISSVLKNEGADLRFSGEVNVGKLNYLGESFDFAKPLAVSGTLRNIGGTLELSGELSGEYTSNCACCGESVTEKLFVEFDESIKGDFTDVDEECFALVGTTLDISGLINALIWSNLPMKLLCREDCKGLCSVCGANLNETVCNCDTGVYDPRLAILREQAKLNQD